jgi:Protein of unknown function (DUF3500)
MHTQNNVTRRDVLVGASALAATMSATVSGGPALASAGLTPLAVADSLTAHASAFLATLDEPKRQAATFSWDGPEWRDWNYFGTTGFVKPGLRFEQMTAVQADAAWTMLSDVLSPAGIEKARRVMLLQDILSAAGNGTGARSSKRFSMSIFGQPAPTGNWAMRLEGHHLSLSCSVADGQIVSVTPAAFAANPNRVTKGAHAGLNTLQGEEQIARRLQADLSPKFKAYAQISENPLRNILSSSGRERAHAEKLGLAVADMTQGQRDLLGQLIETFAVTPYAAPLVSAQQARLRQGDPAATHFVWYGPNQAEQSFGYRVIADSFVIELACVDRAAQHIHPIYHDLSNTLGRSS